MIFALLLFTSRGEASELTAESDYSKGTVLNSVLALTPTHHAAIQAWYDAVKLATTVTWENYFNLTIKCQKNTGIFSQLYIFQ